MMKRIFVLLLALILCLPVMVACNKEDTEEPVVPPPAPQTHLNLIVNDVSEYQIVISADATKYDEEAAYDLRYVVKMLTGVQLPVVSDTAPATDKEIIFGATNRKSLYTLPLDYHDGYIVCVVGQRLIFEARNAAMMNTAISTFVRAQFGVSINSNALDRQPDRNDVAIALDYLVYNDTAAVYQVIYDGSYMQKRYANFFQDTIKSIASSNLVLVETEPNGVAPQVKLVEDDTLESGCWKIVVGEDQKSLTAYAKDYYGFSAVALYLEKVIKENGKNVYPFEKNQTLSGSHVELLEKAEGASAYVYNKTEEYRVMFYNVLWGDPEPQERNFLAATMVKEYMPDVIGFQEFNTTKRNGKNGIPTLLQSAGYVEAFDSKVENMKSKEDGGWGTSGGTKVELDDGSHYYTYYNCVPLFYNQNTTEFVDGGFYWYKNQIDSSNQNNCGATDCASKSLSWGVFRSKTTGEEYMVISTHMCTRSNGVRGKQAEEAVALINELLKTYDVPVFFGGDFNGTSSAANYQIFTGEGVGYIDIGAGNVATEYTAKVDTMHTAPEYNETKELVWPKLTDNAGSLGGSLGSVDHIFLTNEESKQVKVGVFGVVVDECSRSASDHLPLFVDFSIS